MRKSSPSALVHQGYGAGHPWYYFLGGRVPAPKEIQAYVIARGIKGYFHEQIAAAGEKAEPHRTKELAKIRSTMCAQMKQDFHRYRQTARALHAYRQTPMSAEDSCASSDVHMTISLKFNHLVNGFAHLNQIDALPKQLALF